MATHTNIKLRLAGIVAEARNLGEIDEDRAEVLIERIDRMTFADAVRVVDRLAGILEDGETRKAS